MIAEVIVDVLNNEVDKIFEYLCDDATEVGSRVRVSFAGREVDGYVINVKPDSQCDYDIAKLKPLGLMVDSKPVISAEQIALMQFMSEKFYIRKIDVLRLFLPPEMRTGKVKELTQNILTTKEKELYIKKLEQTRKNAKNAIALLLFLLVNEGAHQETNLNKQFGSATVKKLVDEGLLDKKAEVVARSPFFSSEFMAEKMILTPDQAMAVETILKTTSRPTLLHGVTGSGKTEIYLSVIEEVLKNGKTAIMLVPEISLTPQIFSRFKGRFGDNVAIIHSGLSQGERFDEWNKIAKGEAKIVVGARSAIFAPLKNIGVIILDEEHDSSYNSDSNPRFSAIDVARFRAGYNECPLVLGSATPSVESYFKTKTGEYNLITILKRVKDVKLPTIQIVDMTNEIRSGNNGIFSNMLLDQLDKCVKDKKQAMIFINRRGFSSFLRCTECGYIPKCSDCDVSLVYHQEDNELKCHFCGKRFRVITKCPNCGNEHLRYGGVGTERVVRELEKLYPGVLVLRMDNDTVQGKNAHFEILNKFKNTTPAILVGTQMIAKGHDFPNVNLVGIVDADLSLHFSDYRSSERTFQLITQVAGRAGRAFGDGNVVLQTYTPRHFVYKCAEEHNYHKFFDKELNIREVTKFPPFASVLRVLFASENEDIVKIATKRVFDAIKKFRDEYKNEFIYLDAMKSPVKKIQNKFRFQVLMRFKNEKKDDIIKAINKIVKNDKTKGVIKFIEVNPQNLS